MADLGRDAADLGLEPPPRRKSRVGLWIALGCGTALVLAAVCCGGGFLMLELGFEEIEASLLAELGENEILTERIGEVRELEIDWKRSIDGLAKEVLVYRVEGSSGSGWIRLESDSLEHGGEEILWAELELPSGEIVDLYPPALPAEEAAREPVPEDAAGEDP